MNGVIYHNIKWMVKMFKDKYAMKYKKVIEKVTPYDLKTETKEHVVPITFRTDVYPVLQSNNNMATNANIIRGGESRALRNQHSD